MTLQGFKDKYLGKQVEYHSYGGANTHYQCVDLVNQYIKEVLGLTPIIGTNAKDFRGNAEFEWIPNDPNNDLFPKAGDIVVWNGRVGGGAGHIAISLDNASLNHLRTLDQNWSQKQRVTIENHNYNSVSGWLRPKGNMSQITIDSKTFEELVGKSTKLDAFKTTLGSDSASEVKQWIEEYKKELRAKDDVIAAERARADNARKELNTLIQACAKALNTVQEPNQIISALGKLEADLDRLDDLERQYAELQVESGKEKEELQAEVARLKALVEHGDIKNYTTEELVAEIIKRIQRILLRR